MAEWLDKNEVARVLALAKRITEGIRWRKHGGYQEFSVEVLSEEADYEMNLVGVLTEATGYFKLNLFAGSQPIAMLHRGKTHHNPNCEKLRGPVHKHRWSDAHRERQAYEPDDVDLSTMETAFRSFLKECNIDFQGRFAAPGVQLRLS